MMIYGDYSIEEALSDSPCKVDSCNVYVIKKKDYRRFQKYVKYISFGCKHLNIEDKTQLLSLIIWTNIASLNGGELPQNEDTQNKFHFLIISELEDLFSMVTRVPMKLNIDKLLREKPEYEFVSEDSSNVINSQNFDEIRIVILKQNMLHEPKIYEHEIVREWAEKVKRARAKKNKSLEFYEILAIISNEKKISYKELDDYNILQIYADYTRILHNKACETTNNLRAAIISAGGDASGIQQIDYSDGVIDILFKNPDEDLFIDKDNSNIGQVLQDSLDYEDEA